MEKSTEEAVEAQIQHIKEKIENRKVNGLRIDEDRHGLLTNQSILMALAIAQDLPLTAKEVKLVWSKELVTSVVIPVLRVIAHEKVLTNDIEDFDLIMDNLVILRKRVNKDG